MAIKLTDKIMRDLVPPATGNSIVYDTLVKGFGGRITAKEAKSFILNYRINGVERRLTIGSYQDPWTTSAARNQAKALKLRIDIGEDPMAERHADRGAPTVADMADRYMRDHTRHKAPRSIVEDQRLLKQLILPRLGKMRVQALRRADGEAFLRSIPTPTRGNRAMAVCSAMLTQAVNWEWISANPFRGIKRNLENKRERYLSADELGRLMDELAKRPGQSANFIRILLLTGCRSGELLKASWADFDLQEGVWSKPASTTKSRKGHRIPLSGPARQLLSEMRAASDRPDRLFPALPRIHGFWGGVCEAAGITGVRIHDLRHSYASFLVSGGLSLPTIGRLLGHNSPTTTARYAHLADDPLREATERVGRIVNDAGKVGGTVEQLHRKGAA